MEEARRERLELIAAEQKQHATAAASSVAADNDHPVDPGARLEYLLAQSDVFAHFLAGK